MYVENPPVEWISRSEPFVMMIVFKKIFCTLPWRFGTRSDNKRCQSEFKYPRHHPETHDQMRGADNAGEIDDSFADIVQPPIWGGSQGSHPDQ